MSVVWGTEKEKTEVGTRRQSQEKRFVVLPASTTVGKKKPNSELRYFCLSFISQTSRMQLCFASRVEGPAVTAMHTATQRADDAGVTKLHGGGMPVQSGTPTYVPTPSLPTDVNILVTEELPALFIYLFVII